ncbi:MAG: FAD-binding protein [Ilumatobacteraceae bacterium]|nr:FAD-binding protein [Ilumatobacteraceae bacterium]
MGRNSQQTTRWSNWAGNQQTGTVLLSKPQTESELQQVVQSAQASGRRVKAVGSGHSFTAIAVSEEVLVDLSNYDEIVAIDKINQTVTVQSGIQLSKLNQALYENSLAMQNLGDIAYQTIAGAISTSTHGTGAKFTGIANQVVALRIVLADSSIVECSANVNAQLFSCARVGLGALGLISTVTLKVVPAFNLAVIEEPMRVDDVLQNLDLHVDSNDHFEFFWVPHTGWALTKRNNRNNLPIEPMSKMSHWYSKTLMENYAFGAVCMLGKARPSLIPKLAKALPSSGRNEYSDASHKVFASKRIIKFYEMEYAIPREACAEALNRVRRMVTDSGFFLNFPVEVRFTAPDEIPLSTASNRESAYIAVHIYKGMNYVPYFKEVESIMNSYQGRPHWGKLHFQSAATLASRYPQWDVFQAVRNQVDPQRMFSNQYLETVLGK